MSDIVPVVDLNNFLSDNKKSMNDFVQQLGHAYETVGFVAVKNHGISNELIGKLYDNVQRFFALTHRVVNPARELWHTSRFSMPFFLHPQSEMSLACLREYIDADHQKNYEDITAGEYLNERLKEIGLKK